jgi:hypothetical protein
MIIHDLGAEATDIEHLRTVWLIRTDIDVVKYSDVSVIRYIDDSSDHRYGTFVYQVGGGGAWRIARIERGSSNKELVVTQKSDKVYALHEVIPALVRGGYHGARQIASYMMKHCDLEKEKNDEN